ncbi:uroporphyrinogen-III C-methyltransferase [Facklamia lactis]|uniref:uroporphyrinogen-III C-methyltransferase n=1 Tax=Facklamia lactis TaxID=2749967 RepID=UPI0018CF6F03|nr:uroporphyrinogen-III C-methyltransferase [Facklamia lactis]MBG9979503.1 uroporphyrinogen-III C-methyltransferase [Facklamia lactis]
MSQSRVFIVGAGTGRVENLTVKAKRLIETADIIFYDRLINQNILMLAQSTCKKVYVGKEPAGHFTPQDQIIQYLKEASQEYQTIVRLKSGDPYVFGRGGEEAMALAQEGISFEVVPGVTSSIGGLSYAGIPMTYREVALDFHVFTARSKEGDAEHDWEAISRLKGTLVFLMGVKNLPKITQALIDNGKNPTTPVAVVEWASRSQQKLVVGTLETIYQKSLAATIKPPSLIVVGDVVKFNESLNYFMNKPLFGRHFAIPQSQAQLLLPLLEDLGAEVILFSSPTKVKAELSLPLSDEEMDVCLLDGSALTAFINWMNKHQTDWRHLKLKKLTVVGEHTQSALESIGIHPDQYYKNFDVLSHQSKNPDQIYIGSQESFKQLIRMNQVFEKAEFHSSSSEVFEKLENESSLEALDGIIYSNTKAVRSIEQYFKDEKLKHQLQQTTAYCLGEQAYRELNRLGFHSIIQTQEPHYQSLQALLIQTFKK